MFVYLLLNYSISKLRALLTHTLCINKYVCIRRNKHLNNKITMIESNMTIRRFVPKAVAHPQVAELMSDNTSKRGSHHAAGHVLFNYAGCEEVYVVNGSICIYNNGNYKK